MRKMLSKGLALAIAGLGFFASNSVAATMPWDSLGAGYIVSGDMDYWTPTDETTSVNGNSNFEIIFEQASYESAFGVFSYDGVNIDKYEVFAASQEPDALGDSDEETLTYTYNNGIFQLTKNWTADPNDDDGFVNFSSVFGFYFDVYDGGGYKYTFFTDNMLNTEEAGIEHIMTAYDSNQIKLKIYLDDQVGQNRDVDYNDMIVAANDLQPVPEPTTMLLFGAGLAGLAGIRRKNNK